MKQSVWLVAIALVLSACANKTTPTTETAAAVPQTPQSSPQQPAEPLPPTAQIDWARYAGHYPRAADVPQPYGTPLLLIPAIQQALARALPAQVVQEITTMRVEVPIAQLSQHYLLVGLCEAHNCPHAVDLLIDTRQLLVTAILYQPLASTPPSLVSYCHSNQITQVSQLPKAIQQALRLARIAEEAGAAEPEALSCHPRPVR